MGDKAQAYSSFAEVYDKFMDNVPYDEWCGYITMLLRKYGISGGIVLDLGCGTGSVSEILSDAGYDMIGIDNSEDMLAIAMDKRSESGKNILYLLQDMRNFELYGTVRAVVSICDSINYITDTDELTGVFALVNNYLDPDGIFIFDVNTVHKYKDILGSNTIAENREDAAFIWDNYFDEEEMVNEYDLTLFVKEEDDLFRKYEEYHFQKAYGVEEIKAALKASGLKLEAVYDAYTENAPSENSERLCFVARECTKGRNI